MKLIIYEFMKIFTKRSFLLTFLLLITLNGILVWQNELKENDVIKPSAYKAIYKDLEGMTNKQQLLYLENKQRELYIYSLILEEKNSQNMALTEEEHKQFKDKIVEYTKRYQQGNYLVYTTSIFAEAELNNIVFDRVKQTNQYGSYLNNIQATAKKMIGVSIFSKPGTFQYRNIQKTAKDFQKLEGNVLDSDISQGIIMALHSDLTDIIIFLMLLIISTLLILPEKEKGLLQLVKTTFRGRLSVITGKMVVLFCSSILVVVAFYGVNLVMAAQLYGLGDVSRLIQSLNGYIGSSLELSILQYIFLYLFTKVIAFYIVAMVILFLCVAVKNVIVVYLGTLGTLGLSYVLYVMIDPSSMFSFLKYVNLYNFLKTRGIYIEYLNVNVLGYPVNIIPCIFTVGIITLLLFTLMTAYLFCHQKFESANTIINQKIFHKLIMFKDKLNTNLFSHELWKTLIMQKALYVIVLLIGIQYYTYANYEPMKSDDDFYYKGYMIKLAGELTKEKENYVMQQQKVFDKADEEINQLNLQLQEGILSEDEFMAKLQGEQNILKAQQAYNILKERCQYIKELKATSGKAAWFVYDTGYNQLTAKEGDKSDLTLALLVVIGLIAGISGVIAYERSTSSINIIRTCEYGRGKLFIHKSLIGILIALPIYIIVYIPQLLSIVKNYGNLGFDAPAYSLPHLTHVPFDITIAQYIIVIYCIRLVAVIVVVLIIIFISEISKNTVTAMMISTGVLILPIAISLFGVNLLNACSMNTILAGNMIFMSASDTLCGSNSQKGFGVMLKIMLPLIIGVMAYTYGYFRYCKYRK